MKIEVQLLIQLSFCLLILLSLSEQNTYKAFFFILLYSLQKWNWGIFICPYHFINKIANVCFFSVSVYLLPFTLRKDDPERKKK